MKLLGFLVFVIIALPAETALSYLCSILLAELVDLRHPFLHALDDGLDELYFLAMLILSRLLFRDLVIILL